MDASRSRRPLLRHAGLGRGWMFVLRQDARRLGLFERLLERQNRRSGERIVAGPGPVVSLTSYGRRLGTVHLAIESIARGSMLPSRILLWVDNGDFLNHVPEPLRRLQARGLEILHCQDYGPHKKYFPYVQSTAAYDQPLVTADDDVLYTRHWLRGLADAYQEQPEVLNCWRARTVLIDSEGIAPYRLWSDCTVSEAGFLHFATGVSGSILSPRLLGQLRQAAEGFLDVCPRADDIWIHANALRAGVRVRQIDPWQKDYPEIPGSQAVSLDRVNNGQGQNDVQIRATYTDHDVAKLRLEAEAGLPGRRASAVEAAQS